MYSLIKKLMVLMLLTSFINITPSSAQQITPRITGVILQLDSAFWKSYNSCDIVKFQGFFSDDVEFYHDKGGPLFGLPALVNSVKENLCKDRNNFQLRREAIPETMKVYPLEKNHEIYGAVLTGEHKFYITEPGKPEYLTGIAKFTHVWILKDGVWKMTRVISYDHNAAE
ncbi:nuclear transport factor 2 family protein [Chitinophaga sp. Cy-1792]|uniref:nuclear transport factor 2 family protein n=1 Tax=Chitinophaga sp. Cy-1792 TaxID=2608339 RepID=UPI0014208D03|nr:nuclear transport factor 2 family protein [Chitinophaga sp. Cy-1792]NIG53406.1 nuclear transport factor 2 family protein [Chitinophaga sp. Cy-1792]